MLETVPSVVVLLTTRFHNRLLAMSLAGGASDDVVVTPDGAMVVEPGVSVLGLHCIETGEDLVLDRDFAVFHTGKPTQFVDEFVPALRTAVAQLGWPRVRDSLKDYLAGR
jgi:hypothetical protein